MWNKFGLIWSKTNRWHITFFIFLILELRILPSGQQGFICNDPALSYPFTGDTISFKLLVVSTILLPLVIMLLVERKYHLNKTKEQTLNWYKEFLYGLLFNLVLVQGIKSIVGSPRPHFFDTCSPKEALTCDGSEFVSKYTCTKAHWLTQSDRSFPSGHTSLALHAAVFLAYFIHKRVPHTHKTHLTRGTQCVLLALAAYCAASRLTDRRHHAWDVASGALISVPILLYTICWLCSNFECNINTDEANKNANCDILTKDNNSIL